jgi:hypothetical protein
VPTLRPEPSFRPTKPLRTLANEVAFAEWKQLRQTTFLGMREDKDPKELVRDV